MELDRLLENEEFLKNDCITMVEVVMGRLDAPRLLEAQVEIANKALAAERLDREKKMRF